MKEPLLKINMSEARSRLTQLHKILEPGQVLQITKRGKPYALVELLGDVDRYESVLKSIDDLPEPEENLKPVAENYKSFLYGNSNEHVKRRTGGNPCSFF